MEVFQKSYVLENAEESQRLEHQSRKFRYSIKEEFKNFKPRDFEKVLDAGCGSGILTRYLAEKFPQTSFHGIDFSESRIRYAEKMAETSNQTYEVSDLKFLPCGENSLNHIVSRYVIEHIPFSNLKKTVKEFYRCLKPGGKLYIVDFDTPLMEIYPQTKLMSKLFKKIESNPELDFKAIRKLPCLLFNEGFQEIDYDVESFTIKGQALKDELEILPPKFQALRPYISKMLDSEKEADHFVRDYMNILKNQGMTSYYTKFIVTAQKRIRGLRVV